MVSFYIHYSWIEARLVYLEEDRKKSICIAFEITWRKLFEKLSAKNGI